LNQKIIINSSFEKVFFIISIFYYQSLMLSCRARRLMRSASSNTRLISLINIQPMCTMTRHV